MVLGLVVMAVVLWFVYILPREHSHVDGAEGEPTPDGANQLMVSTNAPHIDLNICVGPVL